MAQVGIPRFEDGRIRAALAVTALIITVAVGGLNSSSSPAGVLSPSRTTQITGNVSVTCSTDGCSGFDGYDCENETLNLDSLYVNVDVSTINGHGLDAIKFGHGCSGSVGRLTCKTISEDCVKITGAHDLTIGKPGSSIACTGHVPGAHQDGIQVTNGSTIYLKNIDDACTSATHAQFYVNQVGSQTPTDVYFIGGTLTPDPTHVNNVVINGSQDSGVINSTVCPDARLNPVQIGPHAIRGVNRNNLFPTSCAPIVHPPVCKVPKVTGRKLKAAEQAVAKAHCKPDRITRKYSKVKKGRVISQKPKPGKHLPAGAKVKLVVSKGRRPTSR
jgi:hypothetical protein